MNSLIQIPGFAGSPNSSPIRLPSLGPSPPKLSSLSFPGNSVGALNPAIFNVQTNQVTQPSFSDLSISDVKPVTPSLQEPVKLSIPSPKVEVPSTIKPPSVNNQMIQEHLQSNHLVNSDIEKKLSDLGYSILRTIRYRNNDQLEAKYILAIDHRGNSVLIYLNVDGNITVQPSDLTTTEMISSVNIPYAVRSGIHSAAGNKIAGTAYVCDSGMCVMLTDPITLKPVDSHLTFVEKPANKVVYVDDSPLAIPVIRLSDILENPTLINEIVSESTLSIRKGSLPLFLKSVDQTDALGTEVGVEIKKNMLALKRAMSDVLVSLEKFEIDRKHYDLNPPTTKEAINRYNVIVLNIKKRQNMLRGLLKKSQELEKQRIKLEEFIKDMNSNMNDLNTNYYGVDKTVYTS